MDPQWLADGAFLTGGIVIGILVDFLFIVPRTTAPLRQVTRPSFGRRREHVHKWRMSSAEQTAGKHIHVFVCYDHPQPVVERREVEDAGKPE